MIWIIEPQDPLLVRDGRPFGPTPGARARSLPFPFPSTTTGAARTRAGEENGRFLSDRVESVKRISVRGPMLVELADDKAARFLAPAPGDALPFDEDDGRLSLRLLAPLARPSGATTDLDDKLSHIVGLARPDPDPDKTLRKPAKRPPAFWYWERFERWLMGPNDEPAADVKEIGIVGLPVDRRMHVAIDPATLTGRDGALFMTGGLAFWHNDEREEPKLSGARRLGLAIDIDMSDAGSLTIDSGYGPMGGERRLMHWRPVDTYFPAMPPGLKESIVSSRHCRVILLTPAFFADGWRPGYLTDQRDGVGAELVAAVTGKPQTISGWDLVAKGPRPSRRLVPAGSVFYLKLTGSDDDISGWLDKTWMQCISNTPADRAAGFGLAVVGVWSGVPQSMTTEEESHA